MKASILAAGRGMRLGDSTGDINKCLLEVGERPLVEYSLDCAAHIQEIDEIVIVVGYRAEDIMNRYGDSYRGKPLRYVTQADRRGLVHAIECASDALGSDDFMLMLGDEILVNPRHSQFISVFLSEEVFALCGVVSVSDRALVRKTYEVLQDGGGSIHSLIEKPGIPGGNLMGTGNCLFRNEMLEYIPRVPPSRERGEKELVDLIQCAIADGHTVKSFAICDEYMNVNSPEELDRTRSYFAHF